MFKWIIAATTLVLASWIISTVLVSCQPPIVRAQPSADTSEAPDYVVLARLCVHEEGWSPRGCTAVFQALSNRGHDTVIAAIHAGPQTRRILNTEHNGRNGWKHRLTADCAEAPRGFPANLHWTGSRGHSARCGRIMAHAQRLVSGEERHRYCQGHPTMWGGDCTRSGGACDRPPPGYCIVRCAGTFNIFYRPGAPNPSTGLCL